MKTIENSDLDMQETLDIHDIIRNKKLNTVYMVAEKVRKALEKSKIQFNDTMIQIIQTPCTLHNIRLS